MESPTSPSELDTCRALLLVQQKSLLLLDRKVKLVTHFFIEQVMDLRKHDFYQPAVEVLKQKYWELMDVFSLVDPTLVPLIKNLAWADGFMDVSPAILPWHPQSDLEKSWHRVAEQTAELRPGDEFRFHELQRNLLFLLNGILELNRLYKNDNTECLPQIDKLTLLAVGNTPFSWILKCYCNFLAKRCLGNCDLYYAYQVVNLMLFFDFATDWNFPDSLTDNLFVTTGIAEEEAALAFGNN